MILWLASALSIISGINRIGYYFSSERECKANLARPADYDALIMGNSRIAFTDLKFIHGLLNKFVNAGFARATLPEMYALLKAAPRSKFRLFVLGVR